MNPGSDPNIRSIPREISRYKRKYYFNSFLRGLLIVVSLVLSAWLVLALAEYFFHLSSLGRTVLFFGYLGFVLVLAGYFLFWPWMQSLHQKWRLSDEEAARQIGSSFPSVQDKLINWLQLVHISKNNPLAAASMEQRSVIFQPFRFASAINLKSNIKYLKYAIAPLVLLAVLLVFYPATVTESSYRLTRFQDEFVPQAPFAVEIKNPSLTAFRHEDFELTVRASGEVLPDHMFIEMNSRRVKMKKGTSNEFHYLFSGVQESMPFELHAAGYNLGKFELEVYPRPNLRHFSAYLSYPAYTLREPERVENAGNFTIPEGTRIRWDFQTEAARHMWLIFASDSTEVDPQGDDIFSLERQVFRSQPYEISLQNDHARNKERIRYQIEVIPDRAPDITAEVFVDTVLYDLIVLGGNIQDDYGLTSLELHYATHTKEEEPDDRAFRSVALPIDQNKIIQSFYVDWLIDTLSLEENEELSYYLQVWDNDRIHGRKSARTALYSFRLPSTTEIEKTLERQSQSAENQASKTVRKAEELQKQLEENLDRLKTKRQLDWEDRKALEQLQKLKQELEQTIKQLKDEYNQLQQKQHRFQKSNPETERKQQQLKKLIDELDDPETRKLWEDLKKLMEEEPDLRKITRQMEDLRRKENNLKNDLSRTLELLKRLKMEQQVEQRIQELENLAQKQEELREKTADKKQDNSELSEYQEDIKEDFENFQENMEEIREQNQELERPVSMPDQEGLEQEIEQDMEQSQQQLQENRRKQSMSSQQKAGEKMQQMKEQLEGMQANMQQEMISENINDLRHIVDNLVKLSFAQEQLMNELRQVNQSDPRFVELSQDQLKLDDDAQVIEDSLLALSKRVFFLESFITREVSDMNRYMDEAIETLRERQSNVVPVTAAKQQFAMTSMNNLALMLDDALEQMQQMAASMMGQPQQKQQGQMPSLGEMQQQLNQQTKQLSQSQKSGRQLSEELAKLAAEQERIRKLLEELGEMMSSEDGKPGKGLQGIAEKMEDTELDLVNKNITQRTLERQQEIVTRLLEAEDAMRERELDDKREAETAQQRKKEVPPGFEEYIKAKQQEIELLKTVPPKLNSFYKREVSSYFNRLREGE